MYRKASINDEIIKNKEKEITKLKDDLSLVKK
jgi:hypothetical protein